MPGGRDINTKLRPKKQIDDLIIPRTVSVGSRFISSIRNVESRDLSNYLVLKTIGKGNFAKVKLARHRITKKEVAVKIIDKTKIPAESLQKLFREVVIIKSIEHPNIVRLYEVIQTENMIYLIMEYVSGGELFDYLVNSGRMKENDARARFRQAVSAIQYCHARGIVHRDLKAENLLLDSNGNIKIADFGFCNKYDGVTHLNTFCGSPPYAAPELFLGHPYIGPEVDIWSLGVILFTMVTGTLPFDGETLKELKRNVLSCRYRIPFYMSNSCESLLRKMIVKEPSRRKQLIEIMKDEWLNKGYESSCPITPYCISPERMDDPIRIAKLKNLGIDSTFIEASLGKVEYNHVMATYLLLNEDKVDANFVNTAPKSKSQTESSALPLISVNEVIVSETVTTCDINISGIEVGEEAAFQDNCADKSDQLSPDFVKSTVVNETIIKQNDELVASETHMKTNEKSGFRSKAFTNVFSRKLRSAKQKADNPVTESSEKQDESSNTISKKFYRTFTFARRKPRDEPQVVACDFSNPELILKRASNAANVHKVVNANPNEVISDLEEVLKNNQYSFVRKNRNTIIVTIILSGDSKNLLKIEFELTKLWFSRKYAIKLNRLKGNSMEYKNNSQRILALFCEYVAKKKMK